MSALSLVVAATLSCAPTGHPIVTEVYYDAPGDDTGQEFVELWNDSDTSRVLNGLKLQAGDGAGPGRAMPPISPPISATCRASRRCCRSPPRPNC